MSLQTMSLSHRASRVSRWAATYGIYTVATLTMACRPPTGEPQEPLTRIASSTVSSWPTFSGDCQANWNHIVSAGNSNPLNSEYSFSLKDKVEGMLGFEADLRITFKVADIGVPLELDQNAARHVRLNYHILNTTYQPYGDPGMIHGTVTVAQYQPPELAEFLFSDATLVGHDAVYAGTKRCRIDGTLRTSFVATALGSRCGTDLECGGAGSGRVCDNSTFVCVVGCHVDGDCSIGKVCDRSAARCR